MYITIGEHRSIITHGWLFEDDPVGQLAGTQRRILLGNAGLRVDGRIANFEQARILRVCILVRVDRRPRCQGGAGRTPYSSLASIGFTIDSMNAISSCVRP